MWKQIKDTHKLIITIILMIMVSISSIFSMIAFSKLYTVANPQIKTDLQFFQSSLLFTFLFLFLAFFYTNSNKHKKHESESQVSTKQFKNRNIHLSRMFEVFQALFDDLSELTYLSDVNTYDLLYINAAGKKSFHVGDDFTGKKCYEVLQHRSSPCDFCNSKKLKLNETYTWETTNAVTKRHYLLKDTLVEWDDYPARLEMAFDITKTENEKIELKNMLNAEKMMMDCVRVLYEESTFEDAINHVLEELGSYLSAERSYIFEFVGSVSNNRFEWCKVPELKQIDNLQEIPISVITRWIKIFETGECVTITDVDTIKDSEPDEYRALSQQGIKSLVAVPLEYDGVITGFVGIDNPRTDKLTNIASYLQTLRYFIMNTYRRLESEKKLSKLSYLDNLTSFYNRNRYMEDLEQFAAFHHPIGIVFLDINGLKEINDHFGHYFGDTVLIEFSKTLRSAFVDSELYRIGGDEFVVICKNKTQQEFYEMILQLKQDLKRTPHCKVAIGAQWVNKAKEIKDVIIEADKLMYENKKEYYHKNTKQTTRYRHHSDNTLILTDLSVLKEELVKHNFVIYLQPYIRTADRSLEGAEALVRYISAPDTMFMPNEFLPLLEDTQLIKYLDIYVFEQVCIQLRMWIDDGIPLLPISVNFSRFTLSDPTILERMNDLCNHYGIDKKYLVIEIVEGSSGLLNTDVQIIINKIRQAEYTLSIDDFGTQYANIALLASVEIDILKLDKSIIDNIETSNKNQLIVKSIADYCNALNITIIAEGVENENQFKLLKSFGIHLIQGYLFSRPIPINEFESTYLRKTA